MLKLDKFQGPLNMSNCFILDYREQDLIIDDSQELKPDQLLPPEQFDIEYIEDAPDTPQQWETKRPSSMKFQQQ